MTFAAKFRVKSLGQKKFACLSSASKCFLKQAVQTFTPINRWNLVPHSMSLPKFEIFQVFKTGPIWWVWGDILLCFYLLFSDYKQGWASSMSLSAIQGFQRHMLIHVLRTITFFFLTNMQVWFLYSGLSSLGWFKRIANMKSFDGQSS